LLFVVWRKRLRENLFLKFCFFGKKDIVI
jgi:hypothetical protein